jgi:hypothetical protein
MVCPAGGECIDVCRIVRRVARWVHCGIEIGPGVVEGTVDVEVSPFAVGHLPQVPSLARSCPNVPVEMAAVSVVELADKPVARPELKRTRDAGLRRTWGCLRRQSACATRKSEKRYGDNRAARWSCRSGAKRHEDLRCKGQRTGTPDSDQERCAAYPQTLSSQN